MIYLFENPNQNASLIYDELTLTQEQKEKGIAIEQLPEMLEKKEGYMIVLKCRKETDEVWYEYVEDEEAIKLKKLLDDALELLMESEVI